MEDHRLVLVLVQLARAPLELGQRHVCARRGCGRCRTRRGSRTSITSASSRFISCVACSVLTHGPPPPVRSSGHSSMPPETSATTNEEQVLEDEFHGSSSSASRIIIQRMHRLVLLRHGESGWNRENRFTGWTDVDLSAQGVEEARAAGTAAEGRGLRLRPRLHLGAQARDPHAVARARGARPALAAGARRTGA